MADFSFDISSKLDNQEISNAINQAEKEILHRFDLKDAKSSIELQESDNEIHIIASEEFHIQSINDIFKNKLIKRSIPTKAFTFEEIERTPSGTAKQTVKIQAGIPQDKAKDIVKDIKGSKLKVQTSIQGDQIRVSSKKKDELQSVMALLKENEYGIHMGFGNYR